MNLGLGTKDSELVRIIVSRCEIDMVQIKNKFQSLYNSSLLDFIKVNKKENFMNYKNNRNFIKTNKKREIHQETIRKYC